MSKKFKFLIGLIIVVVVIGLIFGIATIYRFIKLQSILSRVEENIEKNNYYMETTIINNGIAKKTQTYFREGIGKFVNQDGTYTWFDGENGYVIDETEKAVKSLNSEENTAVITKESFASLYPAYTEGFFGRLYFAGNLSNKIKSAYHNGEKCTIIEIKEENYTKTYWITKEFSDLIQAKVEFSNGDVYEYKYTIKFHATKIKDIELPDISGYTIIDNTSENENNTDTSENNERLETQNVVVENIIENVTTNPVG